MAAPHWLDRCAAELRRQHLPACYSARLLEELADHLSELEQETTSMEAQLLLEERIGRPEVVAAEARTEYTRRTFAGRHPVLTFAVAPVFVAIGILLSTLIVLYLVLMLACLTTPQLREASIPPTPLQYGVAYAAVWLVRLAPFGLTAWLFARAGQQTHRPKSGLLACTVIAALAFVFWMGVREATTELPGLVFFGLAIQRFPHPEQYLQAAVPLAIGLWSTRSIVRAGRNADALPSAV